MAHLKRQKVPKNWGIPRKGTAYVVRPNSSGVPLLIVLRDILKVVQNRKEVKKAIHEKLVLVNSANARDDKRGMNLFDTLTLVPAKKNYRMILDKKGKFNLIEIKESEADKKVSKIIDKKTLKKKKTQLNLFDGSNYLSDIKCNTNDSVVIDLKNKKIDKCLVLKEKAEVVVFAGKHAGKKGTIEKIEEERKMVKVSYGEDKINILIKQIMVVE